MNTTPEQPQPQTFQPTSRRRWPVRWTWQATVAVLLVLVVLNGQPVASSYAASGLVARAADVARRVATPGILPQASPSPSPVDERDATLMAKADLRPDFQVTFVRLADGRDGQPVNYTVQVQNIGHGGGMVTVSTMVPPELQNVRVSAPGFACTRRFSASGTQAGTLVSCTRSDLDAGGSAEVTIEANAPNTEASYPLTATADPRDEVAESDESNNEADATIRVRS